MATKATVQETTPVQQVVAVMKQFRETRNTVVFEETPESPAHGLISGKYGFYVPKYLHAEKLGSTDLITVLIEPGDLTKA